MDIHFTDLSEVPLPPNEVRIRALRAEPWPDGRRVHIYMEVDPSQRRPSADLVITNEQGQEVAVASIIENIVRQIEVIMHLRHAQVGERYTLSATLFFAAIPEPGTNGDAEAKELPSIQRKVVDVAQTSFVLPQLES